MHLFYQSQKIFHFGNNVLHFDFVNHPQSHSLFYQSHANVVHILKVTCKEIVYIAGY